jgi:hypothetical protein
LVARLGEDDELWGVQITFDAPTMLATVESAVVRLTARADPQTPRVGTTIRVYEGALLVGTGNVRE